MDKRATVIALAVASLAAACTSSTGQPRAQPGPTSATAVGRSAARTATTTTTIPLAQLRAAAVTEVQRACNVSILLGTPIQLRYARRWTAAFPKQALTSMAEACVAAAAKATLEKAALERAVLENAAVQAARDRAAAAEARKKAAAEAARLKAVPPTTSPVPPGPDPEIQSIIAGAMREAGAQYPIASHDCGPMSNDLIITCSLQMTDGYGMYMQIFVAPGGNYSWEVMGGM